MKRYDMENVSRGWDPAYEMVEGDLGDWVRFEDHEADVATQMADLADENAQLRANLSLAEEGLANYAQENAELRRCLDGGVDCAEEKLRLRAALSRYGHHDGDCEWALTDGAPCSCGLLSLVRGASPQEAKHE